MQLESKQTHLTPEGDLEIDLRPALDYRLRYTSWVKGLWLYREFGDSWQEAAWDHGIPLVHAALRCGADSVVRDFVSVIPGSLRDLVRPFTYNQTKMLQWAARDSRMRDLLASNSILNWLFVDAAQSCQWPKEQIDKVIMSKQHQILAMFTGTSSKSAVRFLRKLRLAKGDRRERDLIYWAIDQPEILLQSRHIKSVSIQALSVLNKLPDLLQADRIGLILREIPPFYTSSDALSLAKRIMEEWQDTERLGNALGVLNIPAFMDQCQSRSSLRRLHDKWVSCFNERKHDEEKSVPLVFPQPPLGGNERIEPICSPEELRQEGREMGHCVGSYGNQVVSGYCYIYRVLQPERATLELRITGGVPRIGQLLLKHNALPSPETEQSVKLWLAGVAHQTGTTRLARLKRFIRPSPGGWVGSAWLGRP